MKRIFLTAALAIGLAHAPPAQAEFWDGPSNTGFANFRVDGSSVDLGVYYGYRASDGTPYWTGSFASATTTKFEGDVFTTRDGPTIDCSSGVGRTNVTERASYIEVQWRSAMVGNVTPFDREAIGTIYLPWDTHLIQDLARTIIETNAPGLRPNPLAGYHPNGFYWNPDCSGNGWAVEIQGNTLFLAIYTHASNGDPVWFISTGAMTSAALYSGALMFCTKTAGVVSCPSLGTLNLTFFLQNSMFPDSYRIAVTLPSGATQTLQRYRR